VGYGVLLIELDHRAGEKIISIVCGMNGLLVALRFTVTSCISEHHSSSVVRHY